ncbi:MAG: putative nickel-responsive regulator [Candidatus Methanocomedens sp.]|nr:MAG: putative nickel-responsive regulator [ANME-2 cluster archaeon]
MTEELVRIGIALPDNLLTHFDELLINNGHSSRSDAIRDAIRRYIQYHDWMNDVKGERVGILTIVYNPLKTGLPTIIEKILFESNEIFLSSLRVSINSDYYLRIMVLRGEGEHLVKLTEKLSAQKGVIHVKLNTVNFIE